MNILQRFDRATKETHYHHNAINLMRVRHKLQKIIRNPNINKDCKIELESIVEELDRIETEIYKDL